MFDLQIICTTFNFVIWIAPTEDIRVLALELQSIFTENDREFCLNKILSDARQEVLMCW
jgi:hypothetical protein